MNIREIHDFLTPDEPASSPKFPVRPPDGSPSLAEWAHPVLVFLTRVLEAHQESLTDEEALSAQQAIGRVRQLFEFAQECELEEGKLADFAREASQIEGELHVHEHVLGALAKRYGGMLAMNTHEIEDIACADVRGRHIDLDNGESYLVWYLDGEVSEDDLRNWAMQLEQQKTTASTRPAAL